MPSIHTQISHSLTLLLVLLSLASPVRSANSAASALMSQAMLSMMDAMGNLAQGYNRNNNRSSSGYPPFNAWQGMSPSPWGMYALPGSGMPGQQQMQGLMTQAPTAALSGQQAVQGMIQQAPGLATSGQTMTPSMPPSPLDGIWQGRGGEIVLAMYGYFRIYANADTYRDGRYEVRGNRLAMIDPASGKGRIYDFALSEGRLVLSDKDGNLLLFRQLPIPVPAYPIFSGQAQSSSQQQTTTNQEQK